eukprot:353350-Chlamydomonas_euryale.AAC.4
MPSTPTAEPLPPPYPPPPSSLRHSPLASSSLGGEGGGARPPAAPSWLSASGPSTPLLPRDADERCAASCRRPS